MCIDFARIERIVPLYRDPADPNLSGVVPQDRRRASGHSLLLLRVGDGAANPADSLEPDLAAEMVRFLSEESEEQTEAGAGSARV